MAILSTRKFVRKKEIGSGDVISFGYTPESLQTKIYTVLVIDPNKGNAHTSYVPKLHGLDVTDATEEELIDIYEDLGLSIFGARLDSDVIYSRYRASPIVSKRIYKTFDPPKIKNPRLVQFGVRA